MEQFRIKHYLYFTFFIFFQSSICLASKATHRIDLSNSKFSLQTTENSAAWLKNILPPLTSPVDLSFLNNNDKPAGKHGFIKRKLDNLVFADGTPAQFWGANIQAYALFTSSDMDIKQHAKRISQLGFNLIRIHHHDSIWVKPNIFKNPDDNTLELSESSFKKLDWWIKCLKDEGIYIWLDLHVGRNFTKNDGIIEFNDLAKGKTQAEVKGFNYYNKDIQALMRAFNKAYLSHFNPYTQLAYKEDPAVISLLLTNENDISHHFGNALLPNKHVPKHNTLFDRDVRHFSSKHKLAYKNTWRTWEAGTPKIYLAEAEHQFNQSMLTHLDQLGVKSLVATTNIWGKMSLYSLPALTDGSIIDAHAYGSANEIKQNPRLYPNFLSWAGAAQVTGYPLSISEWNIEPFPASDRFTAPLLTASIASLQGWDAIMLYGYSQHPLGSNTKGSNYSSYNDPAIMGLMPAAALLYRQSHVSIANQHYELKLNSNDFYYNHHNPSTSKAIRTLLETSRLTIAIPKTTELPWLNKHIINPPNTIPFSNTDKDFIPAGQNFVTSDTGELFRDWKLGIHTINTPKSQIASGWIGGKTISLTDVRFNITTQKAVVAVQSLVNKPLVLSSKIFISLMARARPTKGNKLPFLNEPVLGSISIRAPKGLSLYMVNHQGRLEKLQSLTYKNGYYKVPLIDANTFFWAVLQP